MELDPSSPPRHVPTQAYSKEVPLPPRIVVPPPAVSSDGRSLLTLAGGQEHDFESNGFANTEFLKIVTVSDYLNGSSNLNWKYEDRRAAQKVLPFLYLGPISAAKDHDFLVSEKITMVLAVRDVLSAQAKLLTSRTAERLAIQSTSIDVADNQDLIAALPRGIEMINLHLSQKYQQQAPNVQQPGVQGNFQNIPGRVLIFCETGNGRSAVMATAYIMAMYSTDLRKAMQIVQSQRFAVAFDDSMRQLLSTYESILMAKRDVYLAQNGMPNGKTTESAKVHSHHNKRGYMESEGEDTEGMETDTVFTEAVHTGEREGQAPFKDKEPS